jgi:hypothetical protein
MSPFPVVLKLPSISLFPVIFKLPLTAMPWPLTVARWALPMRKPIEALPLT